MRPYLSRIIGGILVLAFLVALPFNLTIVPIEEVEARTQSEIFDEVAYVDNIWQGMILPTAEEKSVDLAAVLSAIEVDAQGQANKEQLTEVAEDYGSITTGEAHVYLVRGQGTVTAIDMETRTGTMTVDLDGYDGPIVVKLFLGTRIPSDETSMRDAVGIQFGDFREQTEYGKVGSEINKRVTSEVLAPLDKETLVGKTIQFMGSFGIRTFNLININLAELRIVPLQVTVVE